MGLDAVARDDHPLDDEPFVPRPLPGLVIYQARIDPTMDADRLAAVLDNIADLGVTAIELVPTDEPDTPTDAFVPAHVAVEKSFGGAAALRNLIAESHRRGMGVIVEVSYQRVDQGPGAQPDLREDSVRHVVVAEALRWLRDMPVDGLRHDMTPYADLVDASGLDRAAGWELIRELNRAIREDFAEVVLIALDRNGQTQVTSTDGSGGLFHTQWDVQFVHPIREAIMGARPMADVRDAIGSSFGDTFSRVVYTQCRELLGREPGTDAGPLDWETAKRVTLGVSMVLTAPGIPMIFQGQEILHSGTLCDERDWRAAVDHPGIADLVRDLVRLRRNLADTTRGLYGRGLEVFHCDEESRVVAWHRWEDLGPGDDVVVVANLSDRPQTPRVGFPDDGLWRLRFSSDDAAYCSLFSGHPSADVVAEFRRVDAQPASAEVSIGPYSLVVFSQDH